MKNKFRFTLILTSACLLIFILKTFAQEGYKTESFKVSKGGTLKAGLSAGDIQIKTWENNEVKIAYEDDNNEYYDGVKIYQDGNNITIRSENYADFEITCPSEFNLDLNTSGGDIDVFGTINGKVEISTSGGDITLKDINGKLLASTAGGDIKCGNISDEVKLSSGGGDIVVGSVEGNCKVSTGGGDVKVNNVTRSLTVSTGGGNVSSTGVGGDTKITTGGGDISVNDISGALRITTGGGNIYAVNINKGGTVVTGGGDITLKNLSDNIEITTGAGNIIAEFVSVGNKESKVITGYGDITVHIPEKAKVTLFAKVKSKAWGVDKKEISEVIKSDYKTSSEDFNQKRGEFTATYNINGGGTIIRLETSFGNIDIKRLER